MNTFLESFGQQFGLLPAWLLTSTFIFLRFALPATVVFYVVYRLKRRDWFSWKIQQKFPSINQIRSEIGYGVLSSLIYGIMAIGVYFLRKNGYGAMYFDVAERGWGYYWFSIVLMIFAHDAYFYWMHRLMHHPKLFKLLHLVHHQSVNPTPYTAFSFHPLESVAEFAIVPLLALVLPVHFSALIIFTVLSIVFNILGHTGYEISPSGFTRHWLFKWMNTPTHHNLHHSRSKYNYGLYFNIWDRLMGTNCPDYDEVFEQVKTRTKVQLETQSKFAKKGLKTGLSAVVLLLISHMALAQLTYNDIKNGQYGTPEARARQMDDMMQKGLGLRSDQKDKVHDINLRYTQRAENEVIEKDLGNWAKYRKLMAIQKAKDDELEKVLDKEQLAQYKTARDKIFWDAVKDYFF